MTAKRKSQFPYVVKILKEQLRQEKILLKEHQVKSKIKGSKYPRHTECENWIHQLETAIEKLK